ncbi:hypothetical protein LguiB_021373 [Lonicera macranthoides]
MAKLFSSTTTSGGTTIKSTIITTPLNSPAFSTFSEIELQILDFPSATAGLPEGVENLNHCTTDEMRIKFFMGTALLQELLERLLGELRPNYLVADMFFPWATHAASRFGIPRLDVESDSEPFVLPTIPHEIKLLQTQIPQHEREENNNDFIELLNQVRGFDLESYGVIVNSFFELEPDYANHCRNVLKKKVWHIGPLSLFAMGLEASNQPFIWVVRRSINEDENMWLPVGFEERTKGCGLIIRGWAPQLLILDHRAIGSFVMHCGWNLTLEGVCAGLPMVTWPLFAEQFYNEKVVVKRIMVEEEGKEMRRRAEELKKKAKQATEEGGSSYNNLSALIKELSSLDMPSRELK